MSLHDMYMIHGATVNRSSKRRAGVAIRYMPGTSVFERNLMQASTAAAIRSTSRAGRSGCCAGAIAPAATSLDRYCPRRRLASAVSSGEGEMKRQPERIARRPFGIVIACE